MGSAREPDGELADGIASFAAFVEDAPIPIAAVDRDLRYRVVNRAWRMLFDVTLEQCLGRTHQELGRPVPSGWCQLVASCLEGRSVVGDETQVVTEAGRRSLRWNGGPVRGRGGEVVGCAVFAEDVTARREAWQQLAESEERYRLLVGNLPDIVSTLDLECRLVLFNYCVPGIRPEDVLGKGPEAYMPPDDAQRMREAFAEVIRTGKTVAYRGRGVGPNGGEAIYDNRLLPQRRDGEIVAVTAITTDVTEQVQAAEKKAELAEQLLHVQKLESLGVLAGGIAHDFNNLLAAMLGNVTVALRHTRDEDPTVARLRDVERAALQATALCKQMLAYSGRGKFEVRAVDLSKLVHETASLLGMTVSKRARVVHSLASDLPPVRADVSQVQQVVMNLVLNASDALEVGGGTIRITTRAIACDRAMLESTYVDDGLTEGLYVALDVEDDGVGMDDDTRRRMFDPFFTTKSEGRGLGMAAVLGVVRGHGGAIHVESAPGRGTRVRLLLPAAPGEAPVVEPERADVRKADRSLHVLVVDDDDIVRRTVVAMLEELGHSATEVCDGDSAVAAVSSASAPFDVVMLDMTMPGLSPAETLRRLDAGGGGIPVLLTSGYSAEDAGQGVGSAAIRGFLQKPYGLAELARALERIAPPSPR